MRSAKVIPLVALACVLSGCGPVKGPASVIGGECRIFEAPDFAPRGKTRKDQFWIDKTVEAGIAGCDWPRPGMPK